MNNGQPPIPDVPQDWSPNPGLGQPLYGPPAGIGISQLDPATLLSPDQYWNWQTNLQGGIAVFHDKLQQARGWANSEQDRLNSRLAAAEAFVNPIRLKKGKDPLDLQATDQQAILQAIRLYNGPEGVGQFHFDADYVVTGDNLNVKLVGTPTWIGYPAGVWGSVPTDLHLRQPWVPIASKFQGYVQAVLSCKNH